MRKLSSLSAGLAWVLLAGAQAVRAEDAPPPAPAASPSSNASPRAPHHVYLVGQLLVTEPWIELDPQDSTTASAYFVIQNRGGAADKLVSASSTAAESIAVDANGDAPGMGDGSLVIPPRQTVTLERTGIHFTMKGLRHDIANDKFVPGVITFERAGPLHLDFSTDSSQATPAEQADPAPAAPTSLVK